MQIFRILILALVCVLTVTACKSTIAYYRKTRDFAGEHIDRCVDESLKCDDTNKDKSYCQGNTLNTQPLSKGRPCFVTKAFREATDDVAEAGKKMQEGVSTSLAPSQQQQTFRNYSDTNALRKEQTSSFANIHKTEQEPGERGTPVILKAPLQPPEDILPKVKEEVIVKAPVAKVEEPKPEVKRAPVKKAKPKTKKKTVKKTVKKTEVKKAEEDKTKIVEEKKEEIKTEVKTEETTTAPEPEKPAEKQVEQLPDEMNTLSR